MIHVKDSLLPTDKNWSLMVFWPHGGLLILWKLENATRIFFHDSQGSFLQKIANNETARIFFFQGNIDMEFLPCRTPHGGFSSLYINQSTKKRWFLSRCLERSPSSLILQDSFDLRRCSDWDAADAKVIWMFSWISHHFFSAPFKTNNNRNAKKKRKTQTHHVFDVLGRLIKSYSPFCANSCRYFFQWQIVHF